MRSLKLIGKANQAHQDYIAYRKHFTKLERKSRGYVKGNWRLARLRIKMSLSIRRIEFAEAFKAAARGADRETVDRIRDAEDRIARLEQKLSLGLGQTHAGRAGRCVSPCFILSSSRSRTNPNNEDLKEVDMRKLLFTGALAVCALTLISGSLALAGDNWVGTWKLDTAKSKFSPGPGPKSQTLKFESSPEGIKLASEGVAADGKATQGGYTSKFDGNDVPFAGNANADTAQPKKLDDNSYQNTWKKAGKVTITTKGVVSADGKTLTITQSGTDAQGRAVNSTAVYDRQ